ncbi:MAG: alginate lyase family protein, partial [Planctomycetes bacterium]|nr:alginate lyase family protein [Planctomycetota bacterium]
MSLTSATVKNTVLARLDDQVNLTALTRVYRTARHLRLSQVVARMQRACRQTVKRVPVYSVPRRISDLVNDECHSIANQLPSSHPGAKGLECLALLEQGCFRHLNESVDIGLQRPNWHLGPVSENRLWVVTLHYHQWLYELARIVEDDNSNCERARKLFGHYLQDWLRHCDVGTPGSEFLSCNAYAIATRLGWWVRAFFKVECELRSCDSELYDRWLESFWRQAEHLHANLEWDLRANHLLRDAVGLAWVGRFFRDDRSNHWLETASRIAVEQAEEQVLADGGHFERSPAYHLEVMDDFLALFHLLKDEVARRTVRTAWSRMAEAAQWMCHPDGQIAQFNDTSRRYVTETVSAGMQSHEPREAMPDHGGKFLEQFGLAVWKGDPWTLFFDLGEIGPDYQPGHAHADTLSIECAYQGQRLLVDPGCHSYDHDERRRYDRATDSHNTVCIDGIDSSEVWHIFRVGRRAKPFGRDVVVHDNGLTATASHEGYRHLPGKPVHTRTVRVGDGAAAKGVKNLLCAAPGEPSRKKVPDTFFEICDLIGGKGKHDVLGGFLIDPAWSVVHTADGWELACGDRRIRVSIASEAKLALSVEKRPVHPDHGVEVMTN